MTYDPNDLDPSFADVAATMSAKFDELTKDTWVEIHSETGGYGEEGPLKGWAKDPFFEPAVALSGQDIGMLDALYNVITDVWAQTDDGVPGFASGMLTALTHWIGDAQVPVGKYIGDLSGFAQNQQQCLFTLARGLVTYAAIITRSRESLRDMMNKCVEGWSQAGHSNEAANLSIAVALVTAASGISFTVITGGAGALTLPVFGNAVMGVAGNITNNWKNLHGKSDEIANTFLREARDLVDQTAVAIDSKARPDLDAALAIIPGTPPIPAGILDKSKFYPTHGSSSGSRPSQINKALG